MIIFSKELWEGRGGGVVLAGRVRQTGPGKREPGMGSSSWPGRTRGGNGIWGDLSRSSPKNTVLEGTC